MSWWTKLRGVLGGGGTDNAPKTPASTPANWLAADSPGNRSRTERGQRGGSGLARVTILIGQLTVSTAFPGFGSVIVAVVRFGAGGFAQIVSPSTGTRRSRHLESSQPC